MEEEENSCVCGKKMYRVPCRTVFMQTKGAVMPVPCGASYVVSSGFAGFDKPKGGN